MPSIILSEIRCPSCGKRRIRNPLCGGDYYETEEGYRRQEYCNGDCDKNGVLCPPISGIDPDFISNRGKVAVGGKIAGKFRKEFGKSKRIAKDIDSNNKEEFAIIFAMKVQVPLLDVLGAINSLG